jgi:nicotinamidase-related amidase
VAGSPLLDFLPHVTTLINPATDLILTKAWYSAFKDTTLHTLLQESGVEGVVVAGVTATTCVWATARTALELGYHVKLLKDCIGFSSEKYSDFAFQDLEEHGASIVYANSYY